MKPVAEGKPVVQWQPCSSPFPKADQRQRATELGGNCDNLICQNEPVAFQTPVHDKFHANCQDCKHRAFVGKAFESAGTGKEVSQPSKQLLLDTAKPFPAGGIPTSSCFLRRFFMRFVRGLPDWPLEQVRTVANSWLLLLRSDSAWPRPVSCGSREQGAELLTMISLCFLCPGFLSAR